MYLLGYDIGSSSIKAALVDAQTKETTAIVQHPPQEMEIVSLHQGWAEQSPEVWWDHVCQATRKLLKTTGVNPADIKGIGIAYQMHGLVLVDKDQRVLRPSIIWCDSRAVEVGEKAFREIGREHCLQDLLNSPANFTASKLKWVKDNEPEIFEKIHKVMLPGDYIAMKLTNQICTTVSGLSEGIFWNFNENQVAGFLLNHWGINPEIIPEIVPTCSVQGVVCRESAAQLGLVEGIPLGYRAGDQPNNAMSLNVLEPGEVAATGGTSGVVFGVVGKPVYDPQLRVNGFAHVNHTVEKPSIGILLCINGAGIQYRWMKQQLGGDIISYEEIEKMAASVPVKSDGLRVIPFGNGAERVLNNRNLGSHIINLQLNRHRQEHLYRATLEGIAFSFVYGMEVLQEMGLNVKIIKVGNDNLFQSRVFSTTIAGVLNSEIRMVETTGAVGAAKASGIAAGIYGDLREAMGDMQVLETYSTADTQIYLDGYQVWKSDLTHLLSKL